jgi:hypothetical protein
LRRTVLKNDASKTKLEAIKKVKEEAMTSMPEDLR